MMQSCWVEDPLNRPTFTELKTQVEELIHKETPYVDFEVDETKPYYTVPSFKSVEPDTEEVLDKVEMENE